MLFMVVFNTFLNGIVKILRNKLRNPAIYTVKRYSICVFLSIYRGVGIFAKQKRREPKEGSVFMYRIGIDVGGTFTDVTLLNSETGQYFTYKLSSTPQDQSVAISNGAKETLELYGVLPEKIEYFGHDHRAQRS